MAGQYEGMAIGVFELDSVSVSAPCKILNSAVVSNPSDEMVNIVKGFKARK